MFTKVLNISVYTNGIRSMFSVKLWFALTLTFYFFFKKRHHAQQGSTLKLVDLGLDSKLKERAQGADPWSVGCLTFMMMGVSGGGAALVVWWGESVGGGGGGKGGRRRGGEEAYALRVGSLTRSAGRRGLRRFNLKGGRQCQSTPLTTHTYK